MIECVLSIRKKSDRRWITCILSWYFVKSWFNVRQELFARVSIGDVKFTYLMTVAIGTYGIPFFFTMIWPRILSTGMFPPHFKPCSLPLLYVVCLVLIFLERAFTLICPFRHRVTITRSYIHSIIFAWFTGITLGTFSLLAVNGIVDFTHWIVAWPIAVFQPDVCWLYVLLRW